MDPEAKKLLEETHKLTLENNQMLHKMRRSQKLSSLLRLLYWLVIIGVSIGVFYYLEPYLSGLVGAYTEGTQFLNNLK